MPSDFDNKELKKIISFSVYGKHPVYTYGAIENALLAQDLFPGWICRFYYNSTLDLKIVNALKSISNTELVLIDTHKGAGNTAWRFRPMFESDIDIVISRDADSRLNPRDAACVKEWLASDKDFHLIRDHYWHNVLILAGMFGTRNKVLHPIKEQFDKFDFGNRQAVDQAFLSHIVYKYITDIKQFYSHDEQHLYEPDSHHKFPETDYKGYIGEVIENVDMACCFLGEEPFQIKSEDNTLRRDMSELSELLESQN